VKFNRVVRVLVNSELMNLQTLRQRSTRHGQHRANECGSCQRCVGHHQRCLLTWLVLLIELQASRQSQTVHKLSHTRYYNQCRWRLFHYSSFITHTHTLSLFFFSSNFFSCAKGVAAFLSSARLLLK
jgi:hypothetical protein